MLLLRLAGACGGERGRIAAQRTKHNDLSFDSKIFDSLEIHYAMFDFDQANYCSLGTVEGKPVWRKH
jgi:hypothetical protein